MTVAGAAICPEIPKSHSHSPNRLPASPPELLRPPRRGRRPRAHRLPAGKTPTQWGVAVGRGGNGGVFPGGARLPRLPPS